MLSTNNHAKTYSAVAAIGFGVLASTAMIGGAQATPLAKLGTADIQTGTSNIQQVHHWGRWRRPCRWLKRRAYWTGRPYWWWRYRRCMRRHYW